MIYLGATVNIPVHPSNVVITKLKLDKARKQILERRKHVPTDKDKGQLKDNSMQVVD